MITRADLAVLGRTWNGFVFAIYVCPILVALYGGAYPFAAGWAAGCLMFTGWTVLEHRKRRLAQEAAIGSWQPEDVRVVFRNGTQRKVEVDFVGLCEETGMSMFQTEDIVVESEHDVVGFKAASIPAHCDLQISLVVEGDHE
jgi:hypothetical protein